MGRNKVDKTGEIGINNFGSKMIITKYRGALDIDVYFSEYDWTAKGVRYNNFKKGNVKCPYEKRVFGVGYLGEGKYKIKENGKKTKCYNTWNNMLQRCYDTKYHERESTYIDCEVVKEWHNYTNFGDWFIDNYYEIEREKMALDKDILNKGNKIYNPENCVFVPERINTLFIKCDKTRGGYPIGVSYNKGDKKFQAYCRIYDFKENKSKNKHLGLYDTKELAFEEYKQFKEKYIKEVADYYKNLIPDKLYQALYNYKVEIND
mgnify:CR=1 FL=1